ncbi:MAG: SDR family oxidoreductase [Nitrospirae bacterium]|nr:SDR family oxidoreductase [Nitrospirota bacterium]
MTKNFKVLVTGVNGFIGRYLAKSLSEKGYVVRGTMRPQKEMPSLPGLTEIHMVDNIGQTTDWRNTLMDIDVIVHLAARVHVMKETSNNPLMEYRQVNTLGTEQLARQAAASGVKRIVYLSTIKVNGEKTTNKPFAETDQPLPQDDYAISKWEAEQSLLRISQTTNLEVVIIRPPLVYGAGVKGNFYSMLKILQKGTILPLASIKNLRSLIYIGNLSDAITKCIQHPSAANKVFLISDGNDLSTPDIIGQLSVALCKTVHVVPCPISLLRIAGILSGKSHVINRLTDSLAIDSSKIRSDLEWTAPFTVTQGFKNTAEWFKLR